ncbi:MAG: hydroxymethylglutaryl-CoA reductase, degradative [Thermoplasmata archaeon]|nr:hydroxymethylglutaryl-CoA reductase, degradative [Thermoplasmata archaeon]
MEKSSEISGFYKLSIAERVEKIREMVDLTDEEAAAISNTGVLGEELADRMIENVVGTMALPLGIAMNFQLNGKDYLVPMAIEEPSVIAAASNLAKVARKHGGFHTSHSGSLMIGQIQLTGISDPWGTRLKILQHKEEIMERADACDPILIKFGGGARDVIVRVLETMSGPMVITHLIIDTKDAMGANAVNTMAEAIAPYLETITGGRVYLRIISNLATYRVARAWAIFDKDELGGEEVVDGMIIAYHFAAEDPFRCATHNKGIMNGISAVVVASGNDFRAVEAGAHSYATVNGGYKPLTKWEKTSDGHLIGTIEVPMAVGLVGGATKVHPTARANVKILGIESADELGMVMAAVGLAQNAGALRALATEGIQKGHMRLHARNMAVQAGAPIEIVDEVVRRLTEKEKFDFGTTEEVVKEIKAERGIE